MVQDGNTAGAFRAGSRILWREIPAGDVAAAVRTKDDKIFVESIDCRSVRDGNAWIIDYLRSPSAEKVAIDGAAGAPILMEDMKNAEVKCKTVLPKVAEVITANSLFETNLFDGKVTHMAQPSLTQIVSNCEHRNIGTDGGFGYTSLLEQADAGLIESVTLAHWAAALAVKVRKKQTFFRVGAATVGRLKLEHPTLVTNYDGFSTLDKLRYFVKAVVKMDEWRSTSSRLLSG